MISVRCSTSVEYDILIEKGILKDCASLIKKALGASARLAIITDDRVNALHGEALEQALCGFDCVKLVFPNGESSKTIDTYSKIMEFLCESSITRDDAIIAFGGGVVGDMAGFAAATYLRGIRFVQIPTTLLAMVDSSVGGKTAIDLKAGKNLCGAFWQPSLVICDPELLSTLPEDIFSDGMAEVIKYGVICDKELFSSLVSSGVNSDNIEDIIARCVSIKRDIVSKDEREGGIRALLNFGHTAAHGIEKLSDYNISHGRAVGAGMVIAARASEKMGLCSPSVTEDILQAVRLFGLSESSPFSASLLAECAHSDKKRSGDTIKLILPEEVGHCIIYKMPTSRLFEFFRKGCGEEA